jgi:hypothetical protein
MSSGTQLTSRIKIQLTGKILHLFGRAILIREFQRLDLLTLPPTNGPAEVTSAEIDQIAGWIFHVVNIMGFWRWGKCFYRAFIAAVILRQFNVPLILNFGVTDPFLAKRARGHCWLTLHGVLFHEPSTTMDMYPISLGQHIKGKINYWVSRNDDHSISKPIKRL